MDRRTYLTTTTAALAGLAGCLGGDGGNDAVPDGEAPDPDVTEAGLAPDPQDVSDRDVDPADFDTNEHEGREIPLVPLEDAHYWYQERAARFVDARSAEEYAEHHIAGAVHSPAPDGGNSDPVAEWPTDERIVTYCVCPHTLSSMRAANLYENGYTAVYAIDEGFAPWLENGYPAAGEGVQNDRGRVPDAQTITGSVDDGYGGEYAWVRHAPTNQREATRIDSDGSFELHVRFVNVDADTEVTLETPPVSVTAPLTELTREPQILS